MREVENYDSENEDLLPCPFCGAKPIWFLKGNERTRSIEITVKCQKCRIKRTDGMIKRTDIKWLSEVAVKNWNTRCLVIENGRKSQIINGKIVKLAEHSPPQKVIIAFCPECISYGSPLGEDDRVCGNCGSRDCRIYKEIDS